MLIVKPLEQQILTSVDPSTSGDDRTMFYPLKYVAGVKEYDCTIKIYMHWKKVVLKVFVTLVTRSMVEVNQVWSFPIPGIHNTKSTTHLYSVFKKNKHLLLKNNSFLSTALVEGFIDCGKVTIKERICLAKLCDNCFNNDGVDPRFHSTGVGSRCRVESEINMETSNPY